MSSFNNKINFKLPKNPYNTGSIIGIKNMARYFNFHYLHDDCKKLAIFSNGRIPKYIKMEILQMRSFNNKRNFKLPKTPYPDMLITARHIQHTGSIIDIKNMTRYFNFHHLQDDCKKLAIFSNGRIPKYIKMEILQNKNFKPHEIFEIIK